MTEGQRIMAAWRAWATDNKECFEPKTLGSSPSCSIYLSNRLQGAFIAGWHAARPDGDLPLPEDVAEALASLEKAAEDVGTARGSGEGVEAIAALLAQQSHVRDEAVDVIVDLLASLRGRGGER